MTIRFAAGVIGIGYWGIFLRDWEWTGNLREEIDPLDELQQLDKWNSSLPFNLALPKWPIPHPSPLRGPLHLQAKRASCFTSGPGASQRTGYIKTKPDLPVQRVGLYIGRCHGTAVRPLCFLCNAALF